MKSKIVTALLCSVVLGTSALAADYNLTSSSSDSELARFANTGTHYKTLLTVQGNGNSETGMYMDGVYQGINAHMNGEYSAFGGTFNVTAPEYTYGLSVGSYGQDYSYNRGLQVSAGGNYGSTSYGGRFDVYGGDASYNVGLYATASGGTGSTNIAGQFDGEVQATNYTYISDRQFKTDIKNYDGGLSKILALKPRSYTMKVDEFKKRVNLPSGDQIGFIAQELEEVLPELVKTRQTPLDYTLEEKKSGVKKEVFTYKTVEAMGVIPVLVAAVQEQQALIESMRAEIDALKAGK